MDLAWLRLLLKISPKRGPMSSIGSIAEGILNWIAVNARSFSYMLPDALELALYLSLAAYFALQIGQRQA
jgi:hypothetical protein